MLYIYANQHNAHYNFSVNKCALVYNELLYNAKLYAELVTIRDK